MIRIVLGSPWHAFRHALAAQLERHPDIRVATATADPGNLGVLAATRGASLVILDSLWLQDTPDLVGGLAAGPAPPRILLCADSLATPEVLSAVLQGANGCVRRDSEPADWHRAIVALDAGDTWVPRRIMAQALANLIQRLPGRPAAPPNLEPLTDRQREIAEWVACGLSNKEIAKRLDISPMTVKTHWQNIFDRIGVNGRHQLALQTLRRA